MKPVLPLLWCDIVVYRCAPSLVFDVVLSLESLQFGLSLGQICLCCHLGGHVVEDWRRVRRSCKRIASLALDCGAYSPTMYRSCR